jgi:hypothetical protein
MGARETVRFLVSIESIHHPRAVHNHHPAIYLLTVMGIGIPSVVMAAFIFLYLFF